MLMIGCTRKTKEMAWLCCMCFVLACACSAVASAVMHDATLRRDLVEEVLSLETKWNVSVYDGNRNDASDTQNWHTIHPLHIERDNANNAFTLNFIYNYSLHDSKGGESNVKRVEVKMSILCERILYNVRRTTHDDDDDDDDDDIEIENGESMKENRKRKRREIKGQCFLEMSDVAKAPENIQGNDNITHNENKAGTHVESGSTEVYFMYSVHNNEDNQYKTKFVRKGKASANVDDKSDISKVISFISLFSSTHDNDDDFAEEIQLTNSPSSNAYIGEVMLIEKVNYLSTPPQYSLTFHFANLLNNSSHKFDFQLANTTNTSQHSTAGTSKQISNVLKYKLPHALTLHGVVKEDHNIIVQRTAYLAMAQTSNVWTRWGYPVVFVGVSYSIGWLFVKCVAHQQHKASVTAKTTNTAVHCNPLHKHR